ncbi:hypothetical protein LTR95_015989, partial [Oleoguttula sp. CCFEE 5521]
VLPTTTGLSAVSPVDSGTTGIGSILPIPTSSRGPPFTFLPPNSTLAGPTAPGTAVAVNPVGGSTSSSSVPVLPTMYGFSSSSAGPVVTTTTTVPFPTKGSNSTTRPTGSGGVTVNPVGTSLPSTTSSINVTAPAVTLAPVYSSALANLTSAINVGGITNSSAVIPSSAVNPIISSLMANLTSLLPYNALPTADAPTALPSGYATITNAPSSTAATATATATASPGSDQAPEKGMTLAQIIKWLAWLLKQLAQQSQGGETGPAVPAPSNTLTSSVAKTTATMARRGRYVR